jgi:hypothetical protein
MSFNHSDTLYIRLEKHEYKLWTIIGDFLDDFRRESNIDKKMSLVKDNISNIDWLTKEEKALLASIVEYICNEAGFLCPRWTYDEEYFLDNPQFSMNAQGIYKIYLLQDSPKEFRIRNWFVERNCLERV